MASSIFFMASSIFSIIMVSSILFSCNTANTHIIVTQETVEPVVTCTSLQNKSLVTRALVTIEWVAFSWPQPYLLPALRAICIVRPGVVQQLSLVFESTSLPVVSRVPLRVPDLVKTKITRNSSFKPGSIRFRLHIIIILADSIAEDDHGDDVEPKSDG